jgi:hypothetical protein
MAFGRSLVPLSSIKIIEVDERTIRSAFAAFIDEHEGFQFLYRH